MILDQTFDLLKTKYKTQFENLKIAEVKIGLYLTAVKLSDNSFGIASNLPDTQFHCDKKNRDYGDFTPSKITGHKISYLFEIQKHSCIIETLKIAVLNAFSSNIIEHSNYKILRNTDPIDLVDLQSNKTITIVGAFHSYIQKISKINKSRLFVLELNEAAFKEDDKKYYVPANDYPKIVPISDVLIITGLTLVNGTIDGLLSAISPKTQVIVTGPSSSIIPDILFENKVNIIGATRITNPDLSFSIVSEGGAVFHLFEYCAEKICILNEK